MTEFDMPPSPHTFPARRVGGEGGVSNSIGPVQAHTPDGPEAPGESDREREGGGGREGGREGGRDGGREGVSFLYVCVRRNWNVTALGTAAGSH